MPSWVHRSEEARPLLRMPWKLQVVRPVDRKASVSNGTRLPVNGSVADLREWRMKDRFMQAGSLGEG